MEIPPSVTGPHSPSRTSASPLEDHALPIRSRVEWIETYVGQTGFWFFGGAKNQDQRMTLCRPLRPPPAGRPRRVIRAIHDGRAGRGGGRDPPARAVGRLLRILRADPGRTDRRGQARAGTSP